jgi:hypothetical protein
MPGGRGTPERTLEHPDHPDLHASIDFAKAPEAVPNGGNVRDYRSQRM